MSEYSIIRCNGKILPTAKDVSAAQNPLASQMAFRVLRSGNCLHAGHFVKT